MVVFFINCLFAISRVQFHTDLQQLQNQPVVVEPYSYFYINNKHKKFE